MSDNYPMLLLQELEQGRDRRREQSERDGYAPVSLFKKTKRSTWAIDEVQSPGDIKSDTSDTNSTEGGSSVEDSDEG